MTLPVGSQHTHSHTHTRSLTLTHTHTHTEWASANVLFLFVTDVKEARRETVKRIEAFRDVFRFIYSVFTSPGALAFPGTDGKSSELLSGEESGQRKRGFLLIEMSTFPRVASFAYLCISKGV